MSYQTLLAVERHFLDSVLPYKIKAFDNKQFPKSKQFYRPEECIWNNPHRTSNSIYKFYHKYNKDYETRKQPQIKNIQIQDKKEQELTRIRRLSEVKLETKKRLFNRKHQRENLEYLSGSRFPSVSQSQYISSAAKRFSTISHYHSKPTKFETMIACSKISNVNMKNSSLANLENSYITGVEKSLLKKKMIEKLIIQETHHKQQKLREDFQRQRQMNQRKLSRISKIGSSKVEKSFSSKQQ